MTLTFCRADELIKGFADHAGSWVAVSRRATVRLASESWGKTSQKTSVFLKKGDACAFCPEEEPRRCLPSVARQRHASVCCPGARSAQEAISNRPRDRAFPITDSLLFAARTRTTSGPGHPNQSSLPFSCFPVLMFSCQKIVVKGQFNSTQKAPTRSCLRKTECYQ